MDICIVGAGWYGCHLAVFLEQLGLNVTIYERANSVFTEASGKNQFRLHLGFHYARDYTTRMQSRDGFSRFLERYPNLSNEIENNFYAIPSADSLIDFRTYKAIMASSGVEFEDLKLDNISIPLENVAGLINTNERVVRNKDAANLFSKRLEKKIRYAEEILPSDINDIGDGVKVKGEKFDYVIDATWGKLVTPDIEIFYEPTLLLYYRSETATSALTMVDGPLCSVYPTDEENVFTLSSVPHTPLGIFSSHREAEQSLNIVDNELVEKKRVLMEEQIRRYLPSFCDTFEFVGPQLSMKTKPVGAQDNRACYVFRHGRIFSVMSGKIDTVFVAAERIVSDIGSSLENFGI